jgi:hypothetical protein
MYQIETSSGSRYIVQNGRLTRHGDDIRTDPGIRFVNRMFRSHSTPEVGRQWHFSVIENGKRLPFTTSFVKFLSCTDEVYCPTHDMFSCMFCGSVDSYLDAALAAEAKHFAALDA